MDRNKTNLKKFHFIYRTTNLLNGRYYVGLHSTNNVEDDYLGSGTRLRNEINKYGRENFTREILEYLPTRKDLKARERSLVNEDMLKDPLCMNLKLGGEGGWDHIDPLIFKQNQLLGAKAGGKATCKRNGDTGRDKMLATRKAQGTQLSFHGKCHTQEYRERMSQVMKEKQAGKANSQYGTCWVIKDEKPLKIRTDELQQYLDDGYRRGRK